MRQQWRKAFALAAWLGALESLVVAAAPEVHADNNNANAPAMNLPAPRMQVDDEGLWCDEQAWRALMAAGADLVAHAKKLSLSVLPTPESLTPRFHLTWPAIPHEAFEVLIYDVLGQPVRHLLRGQHTDGKSALVWDGKNDSGELVPAGQYWYRVLTDKRIYSKMLIIAP